MCLAGQSYCESAEARERTGLCEVVRFEAGFINTTTTTTTTTVGRRQGVVVELVESNWTQPMHYMTIDTKEVAQTEA